MSRKWSQAEIDLLFELREVRKLKYREMAEHFPGRSCADCATRYNYYSAKRRIAAARKAREPVDPRDQARMTRRSTKAKPLPRGVAVSPGPPVMVEAPALVPLQVVKHPRYFHDADNEIRARIERQGLTAGFLGDPPKDHLEAAGVFDRLVADDADGVGGGHFQAGI